MDATNVEFDPTTLYSNKAAEKASIINLVVANAPPGAARAVVVNGWHTSRSDRRNHCTVDFYDAANNPMGRKHIV
ncbi:hypothetical protein H9Q70_007208 [Fusarium xylarioides]|nr:hypothetical protein H9Q70_007208 [Fusarium xylarioides]KAG5779486.1 hypothetical protein H9Q73_006857 [Fusarium xylarioides]